MEEKNLRKTPLWRDVFDTEGTPLALRKHIPFALVAAWSRRLLYASFPPFRTLTTEETVCAAELMSNRVKIPTLEEMKAKRKAKRAKGKGKADEMSTVPDSQHELTAPEFHEGAGMKSAEASQSKKRKALFDPEEDMENIILKIPRGAAAITDPSSLSPFVESLLLEEDEMRLRDLGPLEASRKAVALSYQVSPCVFLSLFPFFFLLTFVSLM